ncbi:MAG: hypothetical protein WD181_01330 [Solirubrobacterales bacterium]
MIEPSEGIFFLRQSRPSAGIRTGREPNACGKTKGGQGRLHDSFGLHVVNSFCATQVIWDRFSGKLSATNMLQLGRPVPRYQTIHFHLGCHMSRGTFCNLPPLTPTGLSKVAGSESQGARLELARIIHPHPTISEAVPEAARAIDGWATHA